MKNFPIKAEDGKTYWISRSVAVTGIVVYVKDGEFYILANKRGKGTPDFQGYWNCPCGYLDFDETTKEACSREVYEETGIKVKPEDWKLVGLEDSPSQNRQNVTLRYIYFITDSQPKDISVGTNTEDRGGENNEVEAIAWINFKNIDNYEWAFNHKEIINDLLTPIWDGFSK